MPDLAEGQRVTVQGSGSNAYELARDGRVYSCSCPAWRNMRLPIVQRRCKHLIAYLGDVPLPTVTPRARPIYVPPPAQTPATIYDEPPSIRGPRETALGSAIDLHVVLADKMEETFGLRLPKEVAYAAGFWLALSNDEKADLAKTVTGGLLGVAAWFGEGGLEGGGDLRLRDRADDDPPEIVSVMSGATEGERFALLFDEPSELPAGVVIRAGTTTRLGKPSLLETLRERLDLALGQERTLIRLAILGWLDEVSRRKTAEVDEEISLVFQSVWKRGTFPAPYIPGWRVPDDLAGAREYDDRHAAYVAKSPAVDEWIAQAKDELGEGAPGRALMLGRELHMSGGAAFRARSTELLIRAYAMLGRSAFLDVVRAHHHALHPSIPVYELPPPHLAVIAAGDDDADAVAKAWEHSPPNETDVEEAFKRAVSVEVFDAIFDRVDADTRDRACRAALGRRMTQMLSIPAGTKERKALRTLIGRFVERSTLDARAFERIVGAKDDELAEKGAKSVDVGSTSRGETPLHLAARAVRPELVRILIERGADVRAKNARGRMAFDDASAATYSSPRDAHQILRMLEAAGGGVGKVPTLAFSDGPSWAIGAKVTHPKFGDGVVEQVTTTGDDVKLQIRFGKKDVKVLLAKFVKARAG